MDAATPVGRYNWMKVVDVMTEAPVTVKPSDTVGHAEDLMSEYNIRQLPVVDGRELVGVITDRDIRLVFTRDTFPHGDIREIARAIPVRNVMSTETITLTPNDDLQRALAVLIGEKFGGIPVVDDNAGLLGIVTYIDLLRCFLNRIQED